MGGLATSDIIGIAIGVPFGVLALVGVAISFCAWQFPDSRIGKAGVAISNRFSVRGGDARGGDAYGGDARGGDACGGDAGNVVARGGNAAGGRASVRGAQHQDSRNDAKPPKKYAHADRKTKVGISHGGDAFGNSAAEGNAGGGDARGGTRAKGGDAVGGSATFT